MKYIKGLDSLRAFAVLFVLIHHMLPRQNIHSLSGVIEQFLLPTGVFGVTMFFVLSGFLISSILLQAKENNSNKLGIVKNFVVRRALRIFPIYYILLIVLLCIGFPFTKGELPFLFTYTSNFFMYSKNMWSSLGHTWSLSVEEQFYLIWPWLIIFINRKYVKQIFIVFIVIGIGTSFIQSLLRNVAFDDISAILTPSCFDAFGIGGLYAYLRYNKTPENALNKMVKLCFIIALFFTLYWKVCPYFEWSTKLFFLSRSIASLLSVSTIHYVITNKSRIITTFIFENRILVFIGKISYGIYLFHYPLITLVQIPMTKLYYHFNQFALFNNCYVLFSIKVITTIILSYVSFELIEKRVLKFKKRFNY
jgi:peptidoglycan/LPS O-acetylase OafA/YrhL